MVSPTALKKGILGNIFALSAMGLKIFQPCCQRRLKLLSAVSDTVLNLVMTATALSSN
jgi:hypothetical protein